MALPGPHDTQNPHKAAGLRGMGRVSGAGEFVATAFSANHVRYLIACRQAHEMAP